MAAAVIDVTDPALVEEFARRDPALHLYELGDLDPFFWPHTRWWGLRRGDRGRSLDALALLYGGGELPTFIALGRNDGGAAAALIAGLRDRLPARAYAHLSPGLAGALAPRFAIEHQGPHLKMVLRGRGAVDQVDATGVRRLGAADLPALLDLYRRSYPGNWFDPRMLETGQYVGIADREALVCAAGVHVFAPGLGVAALGNVTTDPAHRGRGLARRATARLCRSLLDLGIATIGLNVHAGNPAAVRCYQGLGFAAEAEYDEFMLVSPAP